MKNCFLKYILFYRIDRPCIFDVNFVESYSNFVQRIVCDFLRIKIKTDMKLIKNVSALT